MVDKVVQTFTKAILCMISLLQACPNKGVCPDMLDYV